MARRGGFTFVEALIAILILSVVWGLLFSTFIGGLRGFESRSTRVEMLQEFNELLAFMRRDLRTAFWTDQTPLAVGTDQISFFRVAGVLTGGQGTVGMPALQVVQYAWHPECRGVVRRVAAEGTVVEKYFLAGQIDEGGFRLRAVEAPALAGAEATGASTLPSHVQVEVATAGKLRAGERLALFSRFMGATGSEALVTAWYDNWRVRSSTSASLTLDTDFLPSVQSTEAITEGDRLRDIGLKMLEAVPVGSAPGARTQ